MKTKNLPFLLFLLLLSCGREEEYVMNDFILAGEQNGNGISYIDLSPDIDCTILSPWDKTDTLINLDLDQDGQDDFILEGTMCHPQMLGADCETVSITPRAGAALCVDPLTGWLDTIPHLDTIDIRNHWTSQEGPYLQLLLGNERIHPHRRLLARRHRSRPLLHRLQPD